MKNEEYDHRGTPVSTSRAIASAGIDTAELIPDQVFGRRDPFFFPASILEIIKLVLRVEH